jgi:hypothetical protein
MPVRIARLSILDSYGVRWTRETFARDLLQNFFDSTADFREITVDVRAEEGRVEIRGPATFDIDLLAYIGATTKTSGRTVGGFGEGFKICALVGTRDFGLTMSAGSGAHELAVFFDAVPLGRELCYRVTEHEGDLAGRSGSYVRLDGCDAATIAAFGAAPAMFRHPDNPNLQAPVLIDAAQGVGLYRAPEGSDGQIYYRRQLRGAVRFYGVGRRAVTLAHDGIIDGLEGDRDRRDLPVQPVARAIGDKLGPDDLHRAILELMPQWQSGHDVLAGLLAAAAERKLRFSWPPRWLARTRGATGLIAFAERQGFSIAVAAFAELGMPTPEDHYRDLTTRAASPLELARFQVVADLYEDLIGRPARTTELEVFDMERSAVAGQHLGDRVIVGAQVIAAGFDAASGTILHELSHEAGGEEDIRFLRRLTNLIGAAIREPEKVRAARRRYATVRRPRAKIAPKPRNDHAVTAYLPERPQDGDDIEGVLATLLVPPGFPPTEAVVAALRAAAKEEGVGLWPTATYINGPIGAVTWRAPGVPTVYIGGVDAGGPPDDASPGYRLRTYGPEGRAFCLDPASLRAAIRSAKERRIVGRTAIDLHRTLAEGARERVRAVLGVELPGRESKRATARAERDAELLALLAEFVGDDGGFELADVWDHGQLAACAEWVRAACHDRRPVAVLFDEISDRLNLAIDHASELLGSDPDYDEADAFERDAMEGALGAAVSAYALGRDAAEARSRAEAAFRLVRAATTRVLDLDVTLEGKEIVLHHALERAGLGWERPRTRSFDGARFQAGLEDAAAEAARRQRWVDENGGQLSTWDLKRALDPRAQDPKVVRQRRRSQRMWERWSRATHAIRAVYDRTLAESGSEIVAARHTLEEAARLVPEATR